MDVFISYSGSAQDAEKDLLRLVSELGDVGYGGGWRHAAGGAEADGWSPMLPGIVCDLGSQVSDCTLFIGLLSDRTLISCKLKHGSHSNMIQSDTRLFDIMRPNRKGGYHARFGYSGPSNSVFEIVDGSVSVRHIPLGLALKNTHNWQDNSGPYRADDATAGIIMKLVSSDDNRVNNRLLDFLGLLFKSRDRAHSASALKKLTKDYNCRFAWSSIELERVDQRLNSLSAPARDFRYLPNISQQEDSRTAMKVFQSFWQRDGSSIIRTFDFATLRYSSLVERRGAPAWPTWLQFLVFVSNVGRRANERLRTRVIPNMLRRRKGIKPRTKQQKESGSSRELRAFEPKSFRTLAELFIGHDTVPLIEPELRRDRRRFARRKEILLKIERALYVPNGDTILSLYRGKPGFVPAAVRKPRRDP